VFPDFNNDNLLDIAVVNYGLNNVGILIGYYSANFTIQTKYSTGFGPQPYSVAIGDFNKDSLLDIVIANFGYKNISIRLGFGNGSFGVETTYSTGPNAFPQYVTVGDFNRDNQLDIVVADAQNDIISILLGYKDGTFGTPVSYFMGPQSRPSSIAIGNFNNDKWLDLAVGNEGTNNIGILYGFNYVGFDISQTYFIDYQSFAISVFAADVNNDHRLDIIICNMNYSNVGICLGYGDGTFATQVTYSTGYQSHPYSMSLADFNNDKKIYCNC
jgi:hypothetical protein